MRKIASHGIFTSFMQNLWRREILKFTIRWLSLLGKKVIIKTYEIFPDGVVNLWKIPLLKLHLLYRAGLILEFSIKVFIKIKLPRNERNEELLLKPKVCYEDSLG